ncbi:hypothetical protein OIU83_11695 [Flavobacterium sp. LS1R49]|uniref:Uncharacterized protein n=1 Tax=Flavobacterium shii TaxID=2987687 RepID=A0A9X2YVL3_9FLAO|nr:hypothetical protein [Flavobacterium shii]MCV9928324.1 hypothetical protein [Flavobacterium shii]
MKYIANYKLFGLVNKLQNSILFNGVSTLIFIVFPCTYVFFISNSSIALDKFWIYEVGLIVINIITFLNFYKRGKLLNSTIQTIDIDEENLIVETYPFYILKFWCMKKKIRSVKLVELTFLPDTYPLKDRDYISDQSCFLVKINDNSFYFLSHFFEEEILKLLVQSKLDESESALNE